MEELRVERIRGKIWSKFEKSKQNGHSNVVFQEKNVREMNSTGFPNCFVRHQILTL